jgi:hypothetical protein
MRASGDQDGDPASSERGNDPKTYFIEARLIFIEASLISAEAYHGLLPPVVRHFKGAKNADPGKASPEGAAHTDKFMFGSASKTVKRPHGALALFGAIN